MTEPAVTAITIAGVSPISVASAKVRAGNGDSAHAVLTSNCGAPNSRNPLKPALGAIDEIEVMTDEVLEIALKSPATSEAILMAIEKANDGEFRSPLKPTLIAGSLSMNH